MSTFARSERFSLGQRFASDLFAANDRVDLGQVGGKRGSASESAVGLVHLKGSLRPVPRRSSPTMYVEAAPKFGFGYAVGQPQPQLFSAATACDDV